MRARMFLSAVLAAGLGVAVVAQQPSLTVTSATPNSNAHIITILGSGFGASTPVVTLAAAPLTVMSWSDTAIDAILPDLSAGGYNIVVARIEKGRVAATGSIDVAIGLDGVKGPTGPQGAVGPAGPQGARGDSGPQGIAGPTGGAGPQGDPGPAGAAGANGATGAQGPQGIQGVAGARGTTGSTGPIGPAGAAGPTGPQGASLAFGIITGRALACGSAVAAGARAAIPGTSFDAAAADDGHFALSDVPPGTYDVDVRLDTTSATRSSVVVTNGATVDLGDVVVCASSPGEAIH